MPLFFLSRSLLAVALAAMVVPPAAVAQSNGSIDYSTARLDRKLPAARASSRIELDGRLDEPAWAVAPVAKDFIQNDPREGEPATFDTEVRLLYDDDALYIGVFAKDDQPGEHHHQRAAQGLQHRQRRRLSGRASTRSRTSATAISSRSIRRARSGTRRCRTKAASSNGNWDGVWDVRTRIAEDGWYAEIRIPFRTLKFSAGGAADLGHQLPAAAATPEREQLLVAAAAHPSASRACRWPERSRGCRACGRATTCASSRTRSAARAVSAAARNDGDFDAGFDVKYGVTSGLTWDFTVNTDFSQVEADEQQINLTRFNLFFPEKRDFFLENSGIFQFGVGSRRAAAAGAAAGGQNPSQDMILFFSRRIGLSDAGDGDSDSRRHAADRAASAGSRSARSTSSSASTRSRTPSTNYTALRLRRDILAQSDVGVMFLNKEASGAHFNRVVGADANFRFFQNLDVNFAGAKTFSPDGALPGSGDDWYSKIELQLQLESSGDCAAATRPSASASTTRWGSCRDAASTTASCTSAARFRPQWTWTRGGCARPIRTGRSRTSPGAAAASSRATWTGTGRSRSTTARSSRSASTRTSR